MAGIVFHFEDFDTDVFSGRQIDLDCWRYACKAYEIRKMCMIDLVPGGTQTEMWDAEMDFKKYKSLDEFLADHKDEKCIFVEVPWEFSKNTDKKVNSLVSFTHPKDAWYIFGPAEGFQPKDHKSKNRTWLTVPQDGKGAMHSVHAVILVLYDRYIKAHSKSKK